MKPSRAGRGAEHDDIARQDAVERVAQQLRLDLVAKLEVDGLAERVGAGVGPTGGNHLRRFAGDGGDGALDLSLDRALSAGGRLGLPAMEVGAVVLEHQAHVRH